MTAYYILRPVSYTDCKERCSYTIYSLDRQPASSSAISNHIAQLTKRRIGTCDEILYAVKHPNSTYPYFRIEEVAEMITFITNDLGYTIHIELTKLLRSQWENSFVIV